MNIYVMAPDYSHKSAGVSTLHYLMHLLMQMGHCVTTNAKVFDIKYTWQPAQQPYEKMTGNYDMVILPEIAPIKVGLPVMRWVLYYPGKNGGTTHYLANEVVFHWNEDYKESAVDASYHKESELFSLPLLNQDEFTPSNEPKLYSCYWVYKGYNMHKHPFDALEITTKLDRASLLSLLRQTHTLYAYDRHSMLNIEAILLGVKVMLYNYRTKEFEPFTNPDPLALRIKNTYVDQQLVYTMLESFQTRYEAYQAKQVLPNEKV